MKKMVLPGMNKRRWQRRMLQMKKKTALTGLALLLILCLAWHGLAESQPSLLSQQDSPSNQVVQYVVYEAVFFDNNAVDAVFTQVRGDAVPYEIVTRKYHVTTAFRPVKDARALYGKEVDVHIVGYKTGEVLGDDGKKHGCEGLRVELFSEDKDMMAYLNSIGRVAHITGSCTDYPRYTQFLDYSDMKPLNLVLKGRFGAYLNGADRDSGILAFDAAPVGTVLEITQQGNGQ